MSISSKDAVGLALAAGTVVLLVMHGGDRHDPADTATAPATAAAPGDPSGARGETNSPPEVVAFVDVRLLDYVGNAGGAHVVVVRDGVVAEIAPVGTVDLPADALVVDCGGSGYLVVAAGRRPTPQGWRPVVTGTDDDLVLLSVDPRLGASSPEQVRGRLVNGHWTPAAPTGPVQRVDLGAGH